jgi:hypothetical protein
MGQFIASNGGGGGSGNSSLTVPWNIQNSSTGSVICPLRFPQNGTVIDCWFTMQAAAGAFATTWDIQVTHTDPITSITTTGSMFHAPIAIPSSVPAGTTFVETSFTYTSFIAGDILQGVTVGDGTAMFVVQLRLTVTS